MAAFLWAGGHARSGRFGEQVRLWVWSALSGIVDSKVMAFLVSGVLLIILTGEYVLAYSGGDCEISWYTINGSSGTSSVWPYVLTGTIGQPDADWSEGGSYELLGGFWPGEPLCIIVEFEDFARLAELWLNTGSGLAGDFDGDNDVDFNDLKEFTSYWLACCPADWQLK